MYLLSYHGVREAHSLLVELMSLPGETPFNLFGDAVHEGFPVALWKTSGGNPSDIMRLVTNRGANEYCRAAAIRALTYGVADGSLVREDVIEFLQGLFTGGEASKGEASEGEASEGEASEGEASEGEASEGEASWDDLMVYNSAATELYRLWPGESMELLQKALDEDLIESAIIEMASFEGDLN